MWECRKTGRGVHQSAVDISTGRKYGSGMDQHYDVRKVRQCVCKCNSECHLMYCSIL